MKNTSKKTHSIKSNELGMVSLIITTVLMLIISIIALSFANSVRREQRQQLERQLSTRAFYAAESGVNIATNALKQGQVTALNNCTPQIGSPARPVDMSVDDSTEVRVTCLNIKQDLPDLQYASVTEDWKRIPLNSTAGSLSSVTFSWEQTNAPAAGPFGCNGANVSTGRLPTASSWASLGASGGQCRTPMLRVEMVPVAGVLSRSSLNTSAFSAYLMPINTSGVSPSVGYTSASGNNKGTIHRVRCNAANHSNASITKACSLTITGLNSTNYMARVSTLYGTATMQITARVARGQAILTGAQAVIDSTGQAQDVLRRIQVRKDISLPGLIPDSGLVTQGGVCKQYKLDGSGVSSPTSPADVAAVCGIN